MRITAITLGVEDVARARKFYEGMGFAASSASHEDFVAFQSGGMVFCLYPTKQLAEDIGVAPEKKGFCGVTLAYNVSSKNEVQSTLRLAEECGGTIVKPAQDTFWGGYSGYFADVDGHYWEVAWNPHWILQKDGSLLLPEQKGP